jgi:hypothetical protein
MKDSLTEFVNERVEEHFDTHSRGIEESLRTKVEDVQLGILDQFLRKIKTTYAQRIAELEETTRVNNQTLLEIQGHSARAEDDLQRLANGIRGLIGDGGNQARTEQAISAGGRSSKDRSPQV